MNYKKLLETYGAAIPALNIDETKFIAKGKDRYLIVFVDIVDSTNDLRDIDGNMDKITRFFKKIHENTIKNFREKFGNDFKFKMLGDGLLFFLIEKDDLEYISDRKDKCNSFHKQLVAEGLNFRTVAGHGTLIEVDVGLNNNWTDYYGVAINDIVRASKNMGAEFKWIKG